jgi:hypothetical protein
MKTTTLYLASAIRVAPRVRASAAWVAGCGPVGRPVHAGIGSEPALQHHLQH